jgi:hypothetical protein
MTKKAILSFLMFALFTGIMFADGNNPADKPGKVMKISGQVIDQKTGETLAGVKVFITGTDKSVYTDFDGEFQIECDPTNQKELSFSLISYEGKNIKLEKDGNLKISLDRQR